MHREIIKNDRIHEQYIRIKHKSGCTLCFYPMEGYSSTYALFATKYGSVDTTFKTDADEDFVTVPEGIAHYLEHKLFESEENDAFQLFAKTGASANAFTSFDKTAYLFSCSQKFEENLEILLDFVQKPYFTDETVQKEQGIIAQEIKMYEDDPGWRVFFNALQAVYHNNPVRIDIAGTVDSIARIDKDLLYRCYNTFYNLNNMVLSIAGNFDPEKALEICDRLLKPSKDHKLETIVPDEPYEVKEKIKTQTLSCSIPLFQICFKYPELSGLEETKAYIYNNILFEMLFGTSSPFYTRLYEQGLINDSFSVGVFSGRGFFVGMAEGESRDPKRVLEEIKKEFLNARKNGLSENDFKSIHKKTYGQLLSMFNSVQAVATNMMNAELSGVTVFDTVEITAQATLQDVQNELHKLDVENVSLSIIQPDSTGKETQ